MKSVIVLGGYGNFGQRIAEALASDGTWSILIAGRDVAQARKVADRIGRTAEPLQMDCHGTDFKSTLQQVRPDLVIHTAGPFQGNDYAVPLACARAGSHYVDIADSRHFVSGIGELHGVAQSLGVLVVAGASSLPALSSAVVDEMQVHFSRIDHIEHGISTGAVPPGIATMAAVLSYVGKPFSRWEGGQWRTAHGWQDVVRCRYPAPVGVRWLASCDVPDLALFPERYPSVRSVVFRAGVGGALNTLAVWGASWPVRWGAFESLLPLAKPLHTVATKLGSFGTKWSAMYVRVAGRGLDAKPLSRTWSLLAGQNHGPVIPCLPAIAIARKLLREEVDVPGAMPCMGLLTTDEILQAIPGLQLSWGTETN